MAAADSRAGFGPSASEAPQPTPDDPGYLMTRMMLADEFGSDADHALVSRIPRIEEVEAVVAYGSHRDFRKARGTITQQQVLGSYPVFNFGSFTVSPTGTTSSSPKTWWAQVDSRLGGRRRGNRHSDSSPSPSSSRAVRHWLAKFFGSRSVPAVDGKIRADHDGPRARTAAAG